MEHSKLIVHLCSVLLPGACIVVGVAACGSKNDGQSNGIPGLGVAGAPAAGGAIGAGGGVGAPASSGGTVGAGGPGVVGSGGVVGSNLGGTVGASGAMTGIAGTLGAGGATSTAGATGAGGASSVGAGGSNPSGGASGGTAGTAGAGGMGGVPLAHCDQKSATSAMPNTQACGDMTTVLGTNVKFGPLGAIMDENVGKGFENTDPADYSTCGNFAALFNEPADRTAQLLDVGMQPCNATAPNTGSCIDFKLYAAYRPATWPAGKIPVISWANGTCAQPEGYGILLRYVASYGFFIIAANSRETGTGKEALHALDFAKAANDDPSSPYYGHLDLSKVGVMGHSQGGGATVAAAADSRVQSIIIFNANTSGPKPFLAVSGDLDVTGSTAASMAAAVNGAPKGAYLYYHNPQGAATDSARGHLVLMLTPERVAPATLAWWQMMMNGDATAKNMFVGTSCGLCGSATDYAFGEHGL